jgi:hypothetical protein
LPPSAGVWECPCLKLALRWSLPLASRDEALRNAARQCDLKALWICLAWNGRIAQRVASNLGEKEDRQVLEWRVKAGFETEKTPLFKLS